MACHLSSFSASAASLYWDADGTNSSATGGVGTWDTSSSLWRNGSSTGTLQAWSAGNTAVLGGTAGNVTISAGTSAGVLQIATTGYTLTGGDITITATGNANLSVASGGTATINSQIKTATNEIWVVGGGTVVLGNTSNAFNKNFGVKASSTIEVSDLNAIGGTGLLYLANDGNPGTFRYTGGADVTMGHMDATWTQGNTPNNIFDVAGSGKLTVAASFTGNNGTSAGLTKAGAGTLILTGTSSYKGATNINNGTLWLNGSLGSFSAVTVKSGGTLSGTGTVNGAVTLQSGATLAAGGASIGTLSLASTLTLHSGGTTYLRINKDSGTFALTADKVSMTAASGSIAFTGTLTVVANPGSATLAAGDTFTLFAKGATGSFTGGFTTINLPALAGAMSWDISSLATNGQIKVTNSAAIPVFNPAAGAYLGTQTITISCLTPGATIYYTTDGSMPTTSSTFGSSGVTINMPVNSTMTLNAYAAVAGFTDSTVASATYVTAAAGNWSNTTGGSLSWTTAGNWANNIIPLGSDIAAHFDLVSLAADTTVTLDGARTIGSLFFDDLNSTQHAWVLNTGSGGPLTLAVSSGSPVITSNVGTTINAVLAGTQGLTKSGTGMLTLTAANTYTGGTLVTNGILALGGTDTGNSRVGSGTLTINSGATVRSVAANVLGWDNSASNPAVFINGGTWDCQTYDTSFHTLTMNDGTLTRSSGFWYFGQTNSISCTGGASVISGGEMHLRPAGGTNMPFSASDGATLTISSVLANDSGVAGIAKTGGGALVLSGANTYTGSTIVNGGVLTINGSLGNSTVTVNPAGTLAGIGTIAGPVTINGFIVPAGDGIGTLTINNTLILGAGSKTTVQINKTSADPTPLTNDLLYSNELHYAGTLEVKATGDALAAGDSFVLFDAFPYNGAFSNYVMPSLPEGLSWDVSGLAVNGTITVVDTVPTPIFNLPAGGYIGAQSVTISSDPGTTIHYTMDGSDPLASGTTISMASPVSGVIIPTDTTSMTLTAYATKSGKGDSPVASVTYSTITTPTWTYDGSGLWSTGSDWRIGIPAIGSGVMADLSSLTLTSNPTVTLDSARTIGSLKFGDVGNAMSWTLNASNGSILTLATGSSTPVIDVVNQTATINAVLTGTQGLTKSGSGTLTLNAVNTYAGITSVDAGTLVANRTGSTDNSLKALGDGDVTLTGGTLEITGNGGGLGDSGAIKNITINGGNYDDVSTWGTWIGHNSTTTGSITVNSGTLTSSPTNNGIFVGDSGNGTLAIHGGTVTANKGINIGVHPGSTGVMTITGGVLNTTKIGAGLNGGTNHAINLGGGTIKAIVATTAFFEGVAMANAVTGTTTTVDNNGSAITIAQAISGDGSLAFAGTGTTTLTGIHTYHGATSLNSGTLLVYGSLAASSAVGVAVTATLGGTGTVAGPVACTGVISPGNSGTGTLNTGNATLTGIYECQFDGAASDLIAVSGSLDLTAATIHLSAITPPTATSYTIATYTTTLTAPTLPTLTGLSGYTVDISTNGVVKLIKTAGYDTWAASFPGLSDTTAGGDPDHDGVTNLMEYVIGGDPRISSTEYMPKPSSDGTNLVLSYKRSDASVADTTQVGEWSTDLLDWHLATPITPIMIRDNGTGADDMQIRIPLSNTVNGKLFGRLHVTQP